MERLRSSSFLSLFFVQDRCSRRVERLGYRWPRVLTLSLTCSPPPSCLCLRACVWYNIEYSPTCSFLFTSSLVSTHWCVCVCAHSPSPPLHQVLSFSNLPHFLFRVWACACVCCITCNIRYQLTFAEEGCHGLGSDTSKRVEWESKLNPQMVQLLTSMSFIDSEGWISRQPYHLLA